MTECSYTSNMNACTARSTCPTLPVVFFLYLLCSLSSLDGYVSCMFGLLRPLMVEEVGTIHL
jgi:hypothetical protein